MLCILQLVEVPRLLPKQERCQILLGERLHPLIHVDLNKQLHQVLVLLVNPRNELIELLVDDLQTRGICFDGWLLRRIERVLVVSGEVAIVSCVLRLTVVDDGLSFFVFDMLINVVDAH